MAAVPCEKCGNKMSADAGVCPHCGARRQAGGKVAMSKEELQAFVSVAAPGYQPSRGLWKTLMWPHDETTGGVRVAEALLTVACLPLVLSGLATFGLGRVAARQRVLFSAPGEYTAAMLMTFVGGASFILTLGFAGYAFALLGLEIGLLWTRAWLRETSSRRHKLTAVEKPARKPLPSGAQQTVPTPPTIAPVPANPTTIASSDEPSLLK